MKKIFITIIGMFLLASCTHSTYTIKYVYEDAPQQDTMVHHMSICEFNGGAGESQLKNVIEYIKREEPPIPIHTLILESGVEVIDVYKGLAPVKVIEFKPE